MIYFQFNTSFETPKGGIKQYEGIAKGDGLSDNKFYVTSLKSEQIMVANIEFKKSLFQIILPMKKVKEKKLMEYEEEHGKLGDKKILEKLEEEVEVEDEQNAQELE